MANIVSKKIPRFYMEQNELSDMKFRKLKRKFGVSGIGAYFVLCDLLSKEDNCRSFFDKDDLVFLADDLEIEEENIQDFLDYLLKIGLIFMEENEIITHTLKRAKDFVFESRKEDAKRKKQARSQILEIPETCPESDTKIGFPADIRNVQRTMEMSRGNMALSGTNRTEQNKTEKKVMKLQQNKTELTERTEQNGTKLTEKNNQISDNSDVVTPLFFPLTNQEREIQISIQNIMLILRIENDPENNEIYRKQAEFYAQRIPPAIVETAIEFSTLPHVNDRRKYLISRLAEQSKKRNGNG